ncbi:Transcription factor vrtR1 [Fusarium oxysporum f. sp. albedinis]|nr:Transcription factor vrtR1 [Fusarium oxysporum f. sp. albedinis]
MYLVGSHRMFYKSRCASYVVMSQNDQIPALIGILSRHDKSRARKKLLQLYLAPSTPLPHPKLWHTSRR